MAHRLRPDHRPDSDGPTILARAIMSQLRDLKCVRDLTNARVLYKRTTRGEHCIAILFPPQGP